MLQAKRLYQQFLVDSYSKIETERLQFLRREQKSLHADSYQDLRDALLDRDNDPSNVGRRIVYFHWGTTLYARMPTRCHVIC